VGAPSIDLGNPSTQPSGILLSLMHITITTHHNNPNTSSVRASEHNL
jgi:hypothetical protein